MFGHLVQGLPMICYDWGIFAAAVVIVTLCRRAWKLWYNSKSGGGIFPGNRGLPIVGETLHFMAAINSPQGVYEFVRSRRLRYGRCFETKLFGETHVFMSSMESAKAILNNDAGRFSKRYIKSIAELVGPESLLCASHSHHRLIRAHLLCLFSTVSLASFVTHFDQLVVDAFNGWPHHGAVVIQQEALQARKRIMDTLEKAMNERRSGSAWGHQDFLQRLLAGNDDKLNGQEVRRLTDEEIRDNILTMVIAGQDTTANAITWMVKFVGENQKVLNNLTKEQLQIAKRLESTHLTLEDLNKMPFASKVVKEALRMASVVQWFPRVALEDCEIEGFKIKKGWNVNIDARSIHFDPTVYNDPDVFNPSRFHAKSKTHGFLPFGVGGRSCLGKNMAKAMMLVFLHRLTTTYKWKVIDSDSSIEKWALFSKLRSGCPVRLTSIKDMNKTT
ncbi:abscisic acid 8'-hydroxylase 2 isoform X2 [Neltuma alba]|uniref:abscisic acid 8'-hydroxylase 2 isoform X2 n=1 Tax=Neltuma alba TaxID=207710 RepID=UPI0010A360FA|nr:abscisic acid 8'-hydroxylase 2 isoform X2 [Prosopis alba]